LYVLALVLFGALLGRARKRETTSAATSTAPTVAEVTMSTHVVLSVAGDGDDDAGSEGDASAKAAAKRGEMTTIKCDNDTVPKAQTVTARIIQKYN
jgi:hypothetical protein